MVCKMSRMETILKSDTSVQKIALEITGEEVNSEKQMDERLD